MKQLYVKHNKTWVPVITSPETILDVAAEWANKGHAVKFTGVKNG